jgi:hypothetical protein
MLASPHFNATPQQISFNIENPATVIPAKSRKAGREPGSSNDLIILNFRWIPDLARLRRSRPE